ncbi:prefoldin subunit 1 [[Candida] railenensis]|uniref:Prefoldin subunit 1 n=1 Tax=[Candida] railenensis TaxID=45579 RepID=A0A9P0QL09_9ASCO|nr:prefoldin subunit 1 [[Candida] railenensis]
MSVNQEALKKLLVEMDNQLSRTKAELNMCNLQLSRVDTNLHLIQSTKLKLNGLCRDNEPVWQGVGKAFVKTDVNTYLKEVSVDEKEFIENKSSLEKKKHYLDTTLEKTIENMSAIVGPRK